MNIPSEKTIAQAISSFDQNQISAALKARPKFEKIHSEIQFVSEHTFIYLYDDSFAKITDQKIFGTIAVVVGCVLAGVTSRILSEIQGYWGVIIYFGLVVIYCMPFAALASIAEQRFANHLKEVVEFRRRGSEHKLSAGDPFDVPPQE